MNDKVSVIIPTYNRFKYLLNAIQSVKNQTYKNIEIIVVNDCSTEKEYYSYHWNGVKIIHLKENSRKKFGYPCAGYVRNQGIKVASGKYIAFLDDDDCWLPNKLSLQVLALKNSKYKMCSTDGLIGKGIYDSKKSYRKYNAEYYYNILQNIYKRKGSNLLEDGIPDIWNLDFLKIHNCVICSSVIVEKELLDKVGGMDNVINGKEDYGCWLKLLEHTNCIYLKDICFYYDLGHGGRVK